jgi:fructose/tagatose bisphosphate aldolase
MALSVDHTFVTDETTIDKLSHAIDLGWDAVMLDGSLLPYEENVRLTKKMAEICKKKNANCTGALGEVRRFFPQAQMYKGPFEESFVAPVELMTDPEQAKDFVEKTGVDVLAVAAGQYIRSLWDGERPPFNKTARLDIERIKKIKELTNAHLILMGSTHVNEDDLALAARSGVNMIKIASEYAILWSIEIRKLLEENKKVMFPEDIQKPGLAAVKESMRRFIRLFNANNQV